MTPVPRASSPLQRAPKAVEIKDWLTSIGSMSAVEKIRETSPEVFAEVKKRRINIPRDKPRPSSTRRIHFHHIDIDRTACPFAAVEDALLGR